MSEAFVFGIDGGQTATKGVLATVDGRVLAYGRGAPLVHLAAQGGPDQFVAALRETLADAWRNAARQPHPLAAIGLGLTGVDADGAEAALVRALLPQAVQAARVEVRGDDETALMGAHLDGPGIMVIAGTGSVALGKDRRGRLVRAGGWGWLLGDEGSGLAIGRDGLRAALRALDGVDPPTRLTDIVLAHFGVARPRDIKALVYALDFGARGFAALAPLVAVAARDGDGTARAILRQAADALARQALAVVRHLDFGEETVYVAPVGGAFAHLWRLRDGFTEALAAADPRLVVRDPLQPPVIGALLLAYHALGIFPDLRQN